MFTISNQITIIASVICLSNSSPLLKTGNFKRVLRYKHFQLTPLTSGHWLSVISTNKNVYRDYVRHFSFNVINLVAWNWLVPLIQLRVNKKWHYFWVLGKRYTIRVMVMGKYGGKKAEGWLHPHTRSFHPTPSRRFLIFITNSQVIILFLKVLCECLNS